MRSRLLHRTTLIRAGSAGLAAVLTAGDGFDVVVDCVFGAPFTAALNCTAPGGTVVVVGLTAGRFIWGPDDSTPTSVVATAPLDTLDTKVREGSAAIERVDGRLDLRVAPAKALDPGQGYLEVWLINRDLKRMVSVGVLRSGQTGLFPVSQSLLDQGYVIVDVSREAFDDKPQHSGVSLLRGALYWQGGLALLLAIITFVLLIQLVRSTPLPGRDA